MTAPRYVPRSALGPADVDAVLHGPPPMRVALVTEGNYPLTFGGVSTWCDQLVSLLPEVSFEIVTISGRRGNEVRWKLPPNVTGMTEIGFWEPGAPGEHARYVRAMGRQRRNYAAFRSVRRLLELLLTADEPDIDAFDELFDTLVTEAREHRLAPAMRARWTVELLAHMWRQRRMANSVNDVIVALDVLEHLLRTVSFPVPDADIYHSASNGLAGLVAVAAAAQRNVPVVLSEHGVYLRERYLEYFDSELGPAARDLILRFYRVLSITIYRRVAVVLPVSRYNRRWELRSGVESERIRVIHNGVDPARFPERTRSTEQRPPTIGFVARIDRIKDPATLIRAVDLVRRDIPDVRLRLWGETAKDQDDYETECRSLVSELGLESAVSFEGRTSDPLAAYHSVDVVAMSSISEGLPYGVLEAMMSGVVVVSTDVGGISEALGGVGALVPPRDPEAFAAACVRLLRDRDLRDRLGRMARERAAQDFTVEQMIDSYRQVYRAVLPTVDLRARSVFRKDPRPSPPRPATAAT